MTRLAAGAKVRCPVESTSGREFEILSQHTAEVMSPGPGSGRMPRVPCYLARDSRGKEFVLVENELGRLVSSHHRTITMLRDVENLEGGPVSGEIKARIDAALEAAP